MHLDTCFVVFIKGLILTQQNKSGEIVYITNDDREQRWRTCEPRHDKTNKMSVRPAKTQISLGIRPVWSESSLCV